MGDKKIVMVIRPKHTEILPPPMNAVVGEVHAAQWGLYTKLMKASGYDEWDINHTKKWATRYLGFSWLMVFDVGDGGMTPVASCAAAAGKINDKNHHGSATINGLAVLPDYRNRGIATWLISAVVSRLQRKGYNTIWVSVHTDRPSAITAYKNAGFNNANNEFNCLYAERDDNGLHMRTVWEKY